MRILRPFVLGVAAAGGITVTLAPATSAHNAKPISVAKAQTLGAAASAHGAAPVAAGKTATLSPAAGASLAGALSVAKKTAVAPALTTHSATTVIGVKRVTLTSAATSHLALPLRYPFHLAAAVSTHTARPVYRFSGSTTSRWEVVAQETEYTVTQTPVMYEVDTDP